MPRHHVKVEVRRRRRDVTTFNLPKNALGRQIYYPHILEEEEIQEKEEDHDTNNNYLRKYPSDLDLLRQPKTGTTPNEKNAGSTQDT